MNYIGFTEQQIDQTVADLNRLLCNYQIYYQNLRNYHWNISGQHFFDLHVKFEELYNEAKVNIDEVAERVLTLRQKPTSTLAEYLSNASIAERSTTDAKEMVKYILEDHSSMIKSMRKVLKSAADAEDEGTIDMVAGFLGSIEKKSWMLDAWLSQN